MSFDFDHAPDRIETNSMKWTRYPKNVLPLWVADTDFQAPPAILDGLRAAIEHGVLGYEIVSHQLRKTVATRMETLYGWQVEPAAVVPTPGIVAAFNAAAWALAEPGQGVLIQPPVYPPFLRLEKNPGLRNQLAQLSCQNEAGELRYSVDWDSFRAAIHSQGARTRFFLLCNPHNPTGQVYSRADLLKMAEICLEQGVTIVSDEIHSEILLGGARHIPIATLSPEIEQNTITLVAPSKTYNVPGLYCGFAIIPNHELRKQFREASARLIHEINSMGLLAGEIAYSGACDEWLAEQMAYLTANRDFVCSYLSETLPQVAVTRPQATYLSWLDCRALDLAGLPTAHDFFLKNSRVALNKGEDFGPGGQGFVRLNFGAPRQRVQEALERMAAAIKNG